MIPKRRYLGDGVYITFDGFRFVLNTHDGYRDTNVIVLEPSVLDAFLEYIGRQRVKEIS